MHALVKHITSCFGIVLLSLFFTVVGTQSIADQSAEEIIKGRKALFSKNYRNLSFNSRLGFSKDYEQVKGENNFLIQGNIILSLEKF